MMAVTDMKSCLFHLKFKIYYNLGILNEREEGKYLVQTRLQAKSSGIILPGVHGVDKGIDPNILPKKQFIKPILMSKAKGVPKIYQD